MEILLKRSDEKEDVYSNHAHDNSMNIYGYDNSMPMITLWIFMGKLKIADEQYAKTGVILPGKYIPK